MTRTFSYALACLGMLLSFAIQAQIPTTTPAPATPLQNPPIAPIEPPLSAYGQSDENCQAWTDSCQLCLKAESERIVCSTPGIACIPGPVICTRKKPAP